MTTDADVYYSSIADTLDRLLWGRRDCYGTYDKHQPDSDRSVVEPLTKAVWLSHIRGEKPVGVYPLVESGGRWVCRWIAIDIDREDDYPAALALAIRVHDAGLAMGIPLYFEASKSKGLHAFCFFDSSVESSKARAFGRAILKTAKLKEGGTYQGRTNEVRIFPRQDAPTAGGFGNFLYAPWRGDLSSRDKTVFLDPANGWGRLVKQTQLLAQPKLVASFQIDEIVSGELPDNVVPLSGKTKKASPFEPGQFDVDRAPAESIEPMTEEERRKICRQVRSLRICVDHPLNSTYNEWLAALVHLVPFKDGRLLAHSISALDSKRYSQRKTDEKYDQAVKIYDQQERAGAPSITERLIRHSREGGREDIIPISRKYCYYRGALALRSWEGLTEMTPRKLCNFAAKIEAEERCSDGIEDQPLIRISGALDNGRVLPTITVDADKFSQIDQWLIEKWTVKAGIDVGRDMKAHVIQALRATGMEAPELISYSHTGWTQIDGLPTFLTHTGALREGEPVAVHVPRVLARYSPPLNPTPEEVATAFAWMERFLVSADFSVTGPLLAMMFLAPLKGLFSTLNFVLFLSGQTGSRKSSLAAACLNFWGKGWDRGNLPLSFVSTANAIETLAFAAKDLPLVVDNFIPTADKKMQETLMRIIQGVGEDAGRSRLDRGGVKVHHGKASRALLIITGEEPPMGNSTHARCFIVKLGMDSVRDGILSQIQAAGADGALAPVMGHYLCWLRGKLQEPGFLDKVKERHEHERKLIIGAISERTHRRQIEIEAWIRVGLHLAEQCIGGWKTQGLIEAVYQDFAMSRADRAVAHNESELAYRFLTAVFDLVRLGKIHGIDAQSGGVPSVKSEMFGYNDRMKLMDTASIPALYIYREEGSATWFMMMSPGVITRLVKDHLSHQPISEGETAISVALGNARLLWRSNAESRRATVRMKVYPGTETNLWRLHGTTMLHVLKLAEVKEAIGDEGRVEL